MNKDSKIYVAGHRGMVGSAIVRKLQQEGYTNLILKTRQELDLLDQQAVKNFYEKERPEYVFVAAAKVGGIMANNTYRAEFIYNNLQIQNNLIHYAYIYGVKKLLFLGSSCIYPKEAPQPIKEEYLLTGPLEKTNEPYAIAKIAGIKMCEAYRDQYGANFISVMPTNLYGPNDNFDLVTSHVFPALIRKLHLAKSLQDNDWEAIRKDLNKRPIEGVDGKSSKDDIIRVLAKYGIECKQFAVNSKQLAITDDESTVSSKLPTANRQPQTANRPLPTANCQLTLWGSGKPFREFLHVDDLANASVFLMNMYNEKMFLNIGTGKDITIADLAYLMKDIIGFKGNIEFDQTKPDGTFRKLLDVSRLFDTGWRPAVSLKEGIAKTYHWYLQNQKV